MRPLSLMSLDSLSVSTHLTHGWACVVFLLLLNCMSDNRNFVFNELFFFYLKGTLSTAHRGWLPVRLTPPHRAGSTTTRTLRPKAHSGWSRLFLLINSNSPTTCWTTTAMWVQKKKRKNKQHKANNWLFSDLTALWGAKQTGNRTSRKIRHTESQ